MLIVLPLACYLLLARAFWRASSCPDPRPPLLWAALAWGVLTSLLTELLSLVGLLTGPALTSGWAVAALAAGLAGARQPELKLPLLVWGRPSSWTLALGGPLVVVVGLTGPLALAAWPNEGDSLRYHLARVDHWVQNQSVAFYPTHFSPQNVFPPWSEQAILHLTQLGWDGRVANLVQWSSMLGSLVGVSLIARQLGAGRRGQLFSALFCATLPMGILQATTTQNDYVLAFWVVCLVSALLEWRGRPESIERALGVGAAMGLALLTKGTASPYLLPLLVGLAPYGRTLLSAGWLRSVPLIGLVALALNAPLFARNFELHGFILGPREMAGAAPEGRGLVNQLFTPAAFGSNVVRNASLHLAVPEPEVNKVLAKWIVAWHRWVGLDVSDPRTTWSSQQFTLSRATPNPAFAGNLVQLLLIAALLPWLARPAGWREVSLVRQYALLLLIGFGLFCLLFKWQVHGSRLHLPLFVLWSPVVGMALQAHARLMGIAAVSLVAWSWPFLVGNTLHPLVGERGVFSTSRTAQHFRYAPNLARDFTGAAGVLASIGCREIGLLGGGGMFEFEYPLRALLAEADLRRVRIEHVRVRGASGRLASRWPPFTPCALISSDDDTRAAFRLAGRTYAQAWQSGRVSIFLPPNRRLPPAARP